MKLAILLLTTAAIAAGFFFTAYYTYTPGPPQTTFIVGNKRVTMGGGKVYADYKHVIIGKIEPSTSKK